MLNLDRLKTLVDTSPQPINRGLPECQVGPTPSFRVSGPLITSIRRVTLENPFEIESHLLVLEQLISENQTVSLWVTQLGRYDPEMQDATIRKAYLVLLALLDEEIGNEGANSEEFGMLLSSVLLGEIKRCYQGRRDMSNTEMLQDLIDKGVSPVVISLILDRDAGSLMQHARSHEAGRKLQYLATLKRFIFGLDEALVGSECGFFQAAKEVQRLVEELRDEPMSMEAASTLVNVVVSKGDQLDFWQQLGKCLSYEDRCEIFRGAAPA